eukprot:1161161-Pelagomonas_calceolata.AAC.2
MKGHTLHLIVQNLEGGLPQPVYLILLNLEGKPPHPLPFRSQTLGKAFQAGDRASGKRITNPFCPAGQT